MLAGVSGLIVGGGIGAAGSGDTETVSATIATTDTVTKTVTTTKVKTKVKLRYRTVTETVTTEAAPPPDEGGSGGASGCHEEYEGACVPPDAFDVDCPEIPESDFASVGSDPYGLDRDGDGIACES
jgi:hypothetical protein